MNCVLITAGKKNTFHLQTKRIKQMAILTHKLFVHPTDQTKTNHSRFQFDSENELLVSHLAMQVMQFATTE